MTTASVLKPADLIGFGIARSTAAKLRMHGDGPPYIKRGRSVLYLAADVLAWLESQRVTSTANATVGGDRNG